MDIFPIATALSLGALTSISPCPLATNVAAMSFLGKDLQAPRKVVANGLAYAFGRVVTYGVLGTLLAASLLNASLVSHALQKYLNQAIGPLLIVVGMFLVELLSFGGNGSVWTERIGRRLARRGYLGAGALGILFALSFCPISAALFFGSLIPLAVANRAGTLLSAVYGIGTGLPVLALAVLIGLGGGSLGRVLSRLTSLEKWARRVTGGIFIVVGIYMTLVYVFRIVG